MGRGLEAVQPHPMKLRIANIAVLGLLACLGAPLAIAETPPAQCPAAKVSVYFAPGDTAASPQSEALIGRVSEAVTSCAPDTVYLLAHVDQNEGERALSLALQRLERITRELVARGLSTDRIRTATSGQRTDNADVALRQVDILVSKQPITSEAEDPPPSRARVRPPQDT